MEWIEDDGYWNADLNNDSNYCVSIYDNGKWYATYNPPGIIGGFLSNNLRIECGYGMASAIGIKPNCQFATKEEAIAICEKHQRLIILQ